MNVIGGFVGNVIDAGAVAATIAGGGIVRGSDNGLVGNHVAASFGTIGGGAANTVTTAAGTIAGGYGNAAGPDAAVSGGSGNTASGSDSTVAGGLNNTASGSYAFVAGGAINTASGNESFAAGINVLADEPQCAVFGFFASDGAANCKGVGNIIRLMANHGFSVDWGPATGNGGGTWWVEINDITPCRPINTYTNAYLSCSGVWTSNSAETGRSTSPRSIRSRC